MELLFNIPIALINNICFMAILFIIYECIKGLGNFKPSQLFGFAFIFQITSLIQFLGAILLPNNFSVLNFAKGIKNLTLPFTYDHFQQTLLIIGVIYCAILVYLLIKMAYQFIQLNKLTASADFSHSDHYKKLLPSNLNVDRYKIKIGISHQIETPVTFGWLHPIILMPLAICNQLSIEEIETILIHEIAHVIRKDYLVNLIISVNQIILFFNPFSYFLNKELHLQREIACDVIVIKNKPQKLIYMNALYKVAEHVHFQHQNNTNFTLGIFGTKSELLQRIQYFNHINNISYKSLLYKITFGLLIGTTLLATIFPSKIIIKKKSTLNNITISNKNYYVANKLNQKNDKGLKLKIPNKSVKQKQLNDLNKATYASLVDQTMLWIKKHEPTAKFASYQDEINNNTYEIADKLLIRTIITHYQLKRDLLNQKLAKTNSLKEALDYLLESDEFEQIKQYEKWTKEFLQTHPVQKDTSLLKEEPIIY